MSDEATDEALLEEVARQDADALATLYDRHRAIAYGLALRVTASVPLAEEVLQEAFLGVWRQAAGFDPGRGSGRSWLLAIVHHRAVDAVRRRRSADRLPEVDAPPPPSLVGPDVWPEVAGRLDADAIRRALSALPPAQRRAIELAYWGGLTQAEISAREGLPLGTIKGRMRLGLHALARALRETGDFGDGPSPADERTRRSLAPGVDGERGRLRALVHDVVGQLAALARVLAGARSAA